MIDDGAGRFMGNLITHARNKAVATSSGTSPWFEGNTIAFAQFRGIHISGGEASFINNVLVRNSHVQV